jgi:uncharacterized phage protein gp47/JayE
MTITTNVPDIAFTPTGLSVPAESAVLGGVQADQNAAFGGNLNPALNTPQGQMASSTAAIIADKNAAFAEFVNQVDPDTADGFMQDAIGRIYFMEREPGTPTVVQILCVGAFNYPINIGATLQDTSGNRWVSQQSVNIPIGGSISVPFACTVLGPTACPANTVTTIVSNGITPLNGWDSVNNPAAGAVGANVESRAAFEFRREQSVALNAHGSIVAIGAAVFDVTGVIDVYAIENFTNGTVDTGPTNYPLVAHSIYVAAVGGAPADIGAAIFSKKNDGSNMNGNTTVTIVDPSYSVPQPTYTYTYNIPTNTGVAFAVQIQNSASLPSNIVALVQAAVVAQFTGTNGAQRARTASTILAGSYYGAVAAVGPEVNVVQILLNFLGDTVNLTNITMGIDQFPTLQASDVGVTLV